jgi:membrane protein implicated in regulation of membrane protease activity
MFLGVYDLIFSNFLYFWLIVAIFFLLLEMGSPGLFFFLSFFFGALMAAGCTMLTDSTVLQSIIFLSGSVLSFLILHFLVKKRFSREKHHEHTNVNALKGKHAKVLKTIPAHIGVGVVKIGGDTWSARSVDQKEILVGAIVEIVEVKGSCLIVRSL